MTFGTDWNRVHLGSLANQDTWRQREREATERGMRPMFQPHRAEYSDRNIDDRVGRSKGYRCQCNICGWYGHVTSARHHAHNYHKDRLFDLKVIGVLGRYMVLPEAT